MSLEISSEESRNKAIERLSQELSALSDDDIFVNIKTDSSTHVDIGGGPTGPGRDRRDTGH